MFTILLALLVLALVAGLWWLCARGWIVPAAILLWVAYAAYEAWFQATCVGDCNIRVDLALIWPLLLAASLLAAGALARRAWRRRRREASVDS